MRTRQRNRNKVHAIENTPHNISMNVMDLMLDTLKFTELQAEDQVKMLNKHIKILEGKLKVANDHIKSLEEENVSLDRIVESNKTVTDFLIENTRIKREADEYKRKYRAAVLNDGIEEVVLLSKYDQLHSKYSELLKQSEKHESKLLKLQEHILAILTNKPSNSLHSFVTTTYNKAIAEHNLYKSKITKLLNISGYTELVNKIDLFDYEVEPQDVVVIAERILKIFTGFMSTKVQNDALLKFIKLSGLTDWFTDYVEFLEDMQQAANGNPNIKPRSFINPRLTIK